jgi:hypothetical protein
MDVRQSLALHMRQGRNKAKKVDNKNRNADYKKRSFLYVSIRLMATS